MPEVSFYVLATETSQERDLFACRLIEKAYRSGCFPYVLTDSFKQSQILDDLLWTFRPGSFVPHQVYQNAVPDQVKTILISHNIESSPEWGDTLINLSSQFPGQFGQFERILEILDNSETSKTSGRQRYRQYQQQAGIEIITHKI